MARRISEFNRTVIVTLKMCGKTWYEIQSELQNKYSTSVSKRGMQKIWQKFLRTNETKDLARIGRPRKVSVRTERLIKRISSANNNLSVPQVTCDFISRCSTEISSSTVRRILKKYGIHGYRSVRKPFLSIRQRQKRMLWANKHKDWDFSKWKKVVFSDESIFQCYSHHGKHWVLRTANDKGKPGNIQQTMSHGPKIHVWGCFSSNGVGLLKKIEGSMDAKLYQRSIVNDINVVGKCLVFPDNNFIFQQDLAPPHRALSTYKYFKSKNIDVLDWPGNSPDVNPIENIWGYLKHAMQHVPCKSKEQLWKAVQQHWYSLDRKYCQNLVESMAKRVKSVLNMKGHPTKY